MTFIPPPPTIDAVLAPVTALPPGLSDRSYLSSYNTPGTAAPIVPQDNAYARRNLMARLIVSTLTGTSLSVAPVGIDAASASYDLVPTANVTAIAATGTYYILMGPDFIDPPTPTAGAANIVINRRHPIPDRFSFKFTHTALTAVSYSLLYVLMP